MQALRKLPAVAILACAALASAFVAVARTAYDAGAAFVSGAAVAFAVVLSVLPQPAQRAFYVGMFRVGNYLAVCKELAYRKAHPWLGRLGVQLYAFPGTVTADLAFGIVGELAFDGPCRTVAARISHGTAADIVVGRWFTFAADGTARPGGAAPAGGHAGVFMNPKTQASLGTAGGGALAPTLVVPTGTIGEFGYMGAYVVAVANAVAIGQAAKYNDVTGIISAGAAGAGETAIPNSKFIRYANAAAGLAVLEVTI